MSFILGFVLGVFAVICYEVLSKKDFGIYLKEKTKKAFENFKGGGPGTKP